jgi:hypothetical protein
MKAIKTIINESFSHIAVGKGGMIYHPSFLILFNEA